VVPSLRFLAATFPSNPLVSLLVAIVLFALSVPIARRVAKIDGDPVLARLLMASVVLHMLCAPAQIWVVNHLYHGVADYTGYVSHGSTLASHWRSGHFTLAGSGVTKILGDGFVSIVAGTVMTVVGVDQLAAFLVFAWLAFVGAVFFYRAFAITFPEANRRRYALLVFFLPSLLFWTADVSKEAIMTFSLGLAAYGIARVMARRRGGFPMVALGTALGLGVRPNELVLLLVGFAIAIVLRPPPGRREALGLRRLGAALFVISVVIVAAVLNARLLHSVSGGGGVSGLLNRIAKNNQGTGAGFGSSAGPYSANPLLYPRDVYQLLFDPLPFSARNIAQLVAAIENTIILGVVLFSFRQLRIVLRTARERPYVLVALLYSAGFLYFFAALDNLGLITRERTLLLPLFLVLLAIPVAPKGAAPYPWQRRRRRKKGSSSPARGAGVLPDDWVHEEWVTKESVQGEWVPTETMPREWVSAEWSVASWEALEVVAPSVPASESDPRAGGYRPRG
jgi:hypothetical protein